MTMRYSIIIERGSNNFSAYAPDFPGCVAAGDTRDEALSLIREAIALHIDGLREEGLPIPEPRSEGDVIEVGAA